MRRVIPEPQQKGRERDRARRERDNSENISTWKTVLGKRMKKIKRERERGGEKKEEEGEEGRVNKLYLRLKTRWLVRRLVKCRNTHNVSERKDKEWRSIERVCPKGT